MDEGSVSLLKMRKSLLVILLLTLIGSTVTARDTTDVSEVPRIGVRLNAAVLVGVVNPAVEFSVHRNFTVSLEALGCFYPKGIAFINGRAIIGMSFLEARWYPKKAYKGFFIGPNVGFGVWNMTKGIHPEFWGEHTGEYQVGRNFMCGVTLGYMFSFSKHWGMEISVGGGYSLSSYEGHVETDGSMYVGDNISCEWLPYKAALSVIYKW